MSTEKKAELVASLDYLREVIGSLEDQVAACDKTLSHTLMQSQERLGKLITEVGEFVGMSDPGDCGTLVGRDIDEIAAFMRGLSKDSLALASLLMQAKLREVGVWLANKEYAKAEKELEALDAKKHN